VARASQEKPSTERASRYIPSEEKIFQELGVHRDFVTYVACFAAREATVSCISYVSKCKYAKNSRADERADGRACICALGADARARSRSRCCNAIQSLVTASRQQLFGCTILFAKQSATVGRRFV